jgi:hypothetical protein
MAYVELRAGDNLTGNIDFVMVTAHEEKWA